MIGTNRDLKSIQRILDCRIEELKQFAAATSDAAWISARLTALNRKRITVSAILANRRIEAAKKVVVLSRWLTGNGALHSARSKQAHIEPLGGKKTMESDISGFVVARLDRHGQLSPTYLQKFALAGRNGLKQLAFGPPGTAHLFERRAEAEDVARRLRRRVSQADYQFIAEEAPAAADAVEGALGRS